MNTRRLRRYVEDLLRGRRPRPFPVDGDEAADLRTAITLRAARPGSGAPSEEFVTGLHRRLAADFASAGDGQPSSARPAPTRRRVVQVASATAAAAAVGAAGGAALDHALTGPAVPAAGGATLSPNVGTWHTVAAIADLPDGAVRAFDLGTVNGFVERSDGRLRAVSGVCTHLGCHLALDGPARELTCPCHNAAFALTGELVRHQLKTPPPALPRLAVREIDGAVQIFAP
jgi:nitrite reductase/ring-hydroxylating ferredoxin subunit